MLIDGWELTREEKVRSIVAYCSQNKCFFPIRVCWQSPTGYNEMKELPGVERLIRTLETQRIFFEPLWGNNGDKLITMGSLVLLRRCQVRRVRSPKKADIIVINGGGGMRPVFRGVDVLNAYLKKYPGKIVIVLPSSWQFEHGPLDLVLTQREAPVYLYAREPYSYELLKTLESDMVRIGLDHDMAFQLIGTLFLERLQRKATNRHILVVERGDVESPTTLKQETTSLMPFISTIIPRKLKEKLPLRTRVKLAQLILYPLERKVNRYKKKKALTTNFLNEALQIVRQQHPEYSDLPLFYGDISAPTLYSFKEFCLSIAKAAVVVTTRLHVAILAALLGKPTYLKEGPWHKIRGVYEYSLERYGCVKLI